MGVATVDGKLDEAPVETGDAPVVGGVRALGCVTFDHLLK